MSNKVNWNRIDTSQSQLMDFIATIKKGLKMGLSTLSLHLVSLELYHQADKIMLNPDMQAWSLRTIIENPITGQQKEARTTFQGAIGDTDVESVREMVINIVENCKSAFYPN